MATEKINVATKKNIPIASTTKDMTYVFKSEDVAKGSTLEFQPLTEQIVFGRKPNSNDLYIFSLFGVIEEVSHYENTVTIIVKDYYKYSSDETPNIVTVGDINYNILKKSEGEYGYSCYYDQKTVANLVQGKNVGSKKNTTYNIKEVNFANPILYELGGNDKYNISATYSGEKSNTVMLLDLKGNDKYTLTNGSAATITEIQGNDKYTAKSGLIAVMDSNGKDKYNFANSAYNTVDARGNDTYTIDGAVTAEEEIPEIRDFSGNDKYTIKNAVDFIVTDGISNATEDPEFAQFKGKSGNDKYAITNVTKFKLEDYAGDDKYSFTKASNDNLNAGKYYVKDFDGNDKYSISGSIGITFTDVTGNDSWTLSGESDFITICDDFGTDKYTIKSGVTNGTISDKAGDDVYTYAGSKKGVLNAYSTVYDELGSDKYNLKFVKGDYDTITNPTITDCAGDDMYTVSNSEFVLVSDETGNDTYTIDANSKGVVIADGGGAADMLVLSGAKAKNIKFMADNRSGDMFVYNDKTNTYINIENFFALDDNWNVEDASTKRFSGYGDGRMETVKVGKKALTNVPTADSFTHSIMQNVTAFLETKGDNVAVVDILNSGNKTDINTLVGIYAGNTYTPQG